MSNPVSLSTLMSPRVFLGSFFVSLSVFLYALIGGVLLGPIFGDARQPRCKNRGRAMIFLRLLGIGAAYGVGFALIKSLFPSPIILLMLSDTTTSDGDPTRLALVYMGVGLIAGLIAAPIFGGLVLLRSGSDTGNQVSSGPRIWPEHGTCADDGCDLRPSDPRCLRDRRTTVRRRIGPVEGHTFLQLLARNLPARRLDFRPRPAPRRSHRTLPLTRGRRYPCQALRIGGTAGSEDLRRGLSR